MTLAVKVALNPNTTNRLGPEIRGTKLNRVRKVMKRKLVTGLLCCYHMVSVELWMDKTSHNFLNWYRLTQYISINITMAPPTPRKSVIIDCYYNGENGKIY